MAQSEETNKYPYSSTKNNLATEKERLTLVDPSTSEVPNTDFDCWDPIVGAEA